jgi:hypothetical protein
MAATIDRKPSKLEQVLSVHRIETRPRDVRAYVHRRMRERGLSQTDMEELLKGKIGRESVREYLRGDKAMAGDAAEAFLEAVRPTSFRCLINLRLRALGWTRYMLVTRMAGRIGANTIYAFLRGERDVTSEFLAMMMDEVGLDVKAVEQLNGKER